ncbi:ComEC/Rec2 family competence protein [Roseovarius pelagicus]|uniref:ComEC/Rec2 family competence protein n=1 Tax=Roseovarius pelagicus TaxID=2980108 RepID=UPI0027E4E559|nr:ComEC/Rec2 family competence protein [Roseovarius pelagicus]
MFLLLSRVLDEAVSPFAVGLALILSGSVIAGTRAHRVEGPVLGWRYYGPVEGRIVGIDRSASDKVRITLDQVVLRDVRPSRTPRRVRLSLHGTVAGSDPVPGLRVMTTGHLSPPSGPVEPGGFDFQRHAWFLGLGAVGYTRVPLLALARSDGKQVLFATRMGLSARVQAELPGEAGAFAAAIMTGDRAGMGQETLTALRVSNLAHLLAISGLHMGLLTGFIFAALRIALSAVPWIALRVPVKPVAAGMALIVAAGYLALSGGNVATERAFVMAAVVLVAVMLNRRAFSLRAVALAAIIVLALRPEALLGPGFQMSFAATTALVAIFGWINARDGLKGPRWLRPAMAVVVSSMVAGLATAPFAAAHFNQFAHYGLLANLLSVPLMGVVVMPAAVLAACLLPLGLEWIGLWIMGLGLEWILGVAHFVSGLDGARGTVVSPGPFVLPLLTLGGLFVALWQGRARMLGAVPMVLAFILWSQTTRPDVLISDTGGLVGVMTDKGRALSAGRGAGFIAQNWLENDGDPAEQLQAAERWAGVAPGGIAIAALRGKRAAETLDGCDGAEWLVLNTSPTIATEEMACRVVHPATLLKTGALALYHSEKGVRVVSARQMTGARLWNMRRR